MDAHRFDTLVCAIGRRGILRAVLAMVGARLLPAEATAQAVTCGKQIGARCRRGADCCSRSCQRKKKKKKGRCACSALLKPCFDNFDCCDRVSGANDNVVCSQKDGFAEIVCCVTPPGQCQGDADCCAEFGCNAGQCGPP